MSAEEMVEILDEEGNRTGKILTRAEAHNQSLRHPVIHLWVYNSKGQILMQKRHPKKEVWPNAWDVAIGGHISVGETPEQAVVKEAIEELGIKIDPINIKFIGKFKFTEKMPRGWTNKTQISSYITKKDIDIAELNFEKDEVSGAQWFEVEKLEKILNDPQDVKSLSSDILEDSITAITYIGKNWGEQ